MNIFSFVTVAGTYTLKEGWSSVLIVPNGSVQIVNGASPPQSITITSALKLGSGGDIYGDLIINGNASLVINGDAVSGAPDSSTPVGTSWDISGNTLSARGIFGSIAGAFGYDEVMDGVVFGGVNNDTSRFFGTTASFADTNYSFQTLGNTNATFGLQIQNLGNTQRAFFRNDGLFSATGGLSTDGVKSIFIDTATIRYSIGSNAGSSSGNIVNSFGESAGLNNTGTIINGFGYESCAYNSGSDVIGIGYRAARGNVSNSVIALGQDTGFGNAGFNVTALGQNAAFGNTTNRIFVASYVDNIFWNNVGDKFNDGLNTVSMQSAMSFDGTNTSAALSVMSYDAALGTGNALPGDITWMYAVVQASGTTRHTKALALTMNGATGKFTFEKTINVPLVNYANNAAAIAGGLIVNDYYRTAGAVNIVI